MMHLLGPLMPIALPRSSSISGHQACQHPFLMMVRFSLTGSAFDAMQPAKIMRYGRARMRALGLHLPRGPSCAHISCWFARGGFVPETRVQLPLSDMSVRRLFCKWAGGFAWRMLCASVLCALECMWVMRGIAFSSAQL